MTQLWFVFPISDFASFRRRPQAAGNSRSRLFVRYLYILEGVCCFFDRLQIYYHSKVTCVLSEIFCLVLVAQPGKTYLPGLLPDSFHKQKKTYLAARGVSKSSG